MTTATPPIAHCRSCGAAIYWVVSVNGVRMPIDVGPDADGNVLLSVNSHGDLKAVVLKRDAERVTGRKYYVSHHATCPNAAAHRRK